MELLTPELRETLLANGRSPDGDFRPAVKFFNPCGAGTWLVTHADPHDRDILGCLADLGMGCPGTRQREALGASVLPGPLRPRHRARSLVRRAVMADLRVCPSRQARQPHRGIRARTRCRRRTPSRDRRGGHLTAPDPCHTPCPAPRPGLSRDGAILFPAAFLETFDARYRNRGPGRIETRRSGAGPAPDGPAPGRKPLAPVRGVPDLAARPRTP